MPKTAGVSVPRCVRFPPLADTSGLTLKQPHHILVNISGKDGFSPFACSTLLHAMLRRFHPPAIPADGNDPGGASGVPADPLKLLMQTLDAQALERLRELDPTGANDLLGRVLKAFDGSLKRLLQQLQEARAVDDLSAIRHVAHTLKSSAASVGALELSRLCAEIERSIRQDDTDGLDGLVDGMVGESARLLTALKPALNA